MSTRTTQFDVETGRSLTRSTAQQRSRSEGRYEGREGRTAHRSRSGTSEPEPTEVSTSHKKAHGKTSEKAQSLKISKARIHAASAKGESSPQTLDYASSGQYPASRNTQDYSPKAPSNLYASKHMADLERTKFMDNIPGIPASEQLAQRGDRAGRTPFPPPSVYNYGQNVAYPSALSSDLKAFPRDSNNTTDPVFHKSPANRHAKGLRGKRQEETDMQWNATQENNYRLRDEQRNRAATSEFHYTRTRGRRTKDGVNVVYNDVKFSGSNRPNVSRRSTSTSSYSESPTDSHDSSTESESFSSSDTSLKRRRRIKRKPSTKSIGSSVYGEDNTSESENQSVSEMSASDSAYSYRKQRTQFSPEETDIGSFVTFKEFRSTSNKLRSSSLTSVSSLEGAGILGDPAVRNQSPLVSPKGTGISKVKKIQIRSFTSFTDDQLNNKENLPQRRRSTEEKDPFKMRGRAETVPKDIIKTSLARQGTESPLLSKSPFGLKSKSTVRKTSKESLFSDSECNHMCTPEKEQADSDTRSESFEIAVAQEQVERCNSAPPVPQPIETRDSRSHHNLTDTSGLLSSRSAFSPVKPNKRTNDHEPNPPIMAPVNFVSNARNENGSSTTGDVLLQPVARRGNRPLSIVQETDEFADMTHEDGSYKNESIEKILKKSHGTRGSHERTSQDPRSSPPSLEDISKLRRLSYVKAQINSAEIPSQSPDLTAQTLDINSACDSSPSFAPEKVLKEFDQTDPHEILRTVASPVAEGDLISFDDENREVNEPVKKRTRRIARPKIPTILGGEELIRNEQTTGVVLEQNEVTFSKGKYSNIYSVNSNFTCTFSPVIWNQSTDRQWFVSPERLRATTKINTNFV